MTGASEVAAVVCVLASIFCAGGLFGLHLAWSQEHRMGKWAARYADLYEKATRGGA